MICPSVNLIHTWTQNFENLYSSCQHGVATANVQLLVWLLLLLFS